jgi:CTP:molybdopterin cytidylyltransferase MocA
LNRGRDAAVITPVDRPPVRSETIVQLRRAFELSERSVWAVVPEHDGHHGHPIVVGREMITAFLQAPATSNAREVQHLNQAHIAYVTVEDELIAENINTPEQYKRIAQE